MKSSNDPQNDDLRGLLRELGRAGERDAQSFSNTWRAAKARQGETTSHWRPAWIAATAAAATVLFAVAMWPSKPTTETHAPIAVEITGDEALPTDFLLVTNNNDPVERLSSEIDALLQP